MTQEQKAKKVSEIASDFTMIVQQIDTAKEKLQKLYYNDITIDDNVASNLCYYLLQAYRDMEKAIKENICNLSKN